MFEELEKIELAEEVFGTDFPVDLTEDLTVNNPRRLLHSAPERLGTNPCRRRFLETTRNEA